MVDWRDPDVIAFDVEVLLHVSTILLGFYGWYFLTSLSDIEIPLLFSQLRFKFAYFPYLLGRYILLLDLILIFVSTTDRNPMNCEILYRLCAILGNAGIGIASLNLMLRSFVIWWYNKPVLVFLVAVCIPQWAIIIWTADSPGAMWDPVKKTCNPMALTAELIEALYSYTIAFDLTILGFTIWGLRTIGHSPMRTVITMQGIWYFVLTSIMSIVNMVFARLRLNYVMDTMFALPAVTISVIVSSRAVIVLRSMNDFAGPPPDESNAAQGRSDHWWRMIWPQRTECGEFTTEDGILAVPPQDDSEVHPRWDRRWEDWSSVSVATQPAPDVQEVRLSLVQTGSSMATTMTGVCSPSEITSDNSERCR
ncbi:hypothetical protein OBBRIDRAFT_508477 [Obba rivulosa]|uniref:Uncharacterized protein n=1 Tax=Obba rivulosa TaxID=1052685 RepID=A0A8E2B0R2_9APHY|nr:hypothetical protein OBBRIDRAFT_508477 [Obba rivulosa]